MASSSASTSCRAPPSSPPPACAATSWPHSPSPLPGSRAQERLEAVNHAVRCLIAGLGRHGPLRAVAASATGRVGGGSTVLQTDLVPVWTGFPLAERLSAELGVPAVVDNDINAAALGEFHARRQQGRIRPNGVLLFVQLARGLHTGLVLGGAIHRGHEFNAGEIADFLALHLDEDTHVSGSWVTRAVLTTASVGAVVDPDAIVFSSSVSSRGTVTRVLEALSALRPPSTLSFAAEVSALGWAAGVVGATHLALAAADQALTGTPRPLPVTLTGTSLFLSTLEKSRHTTMTTTLRPPPHAARRRRGRRSPFRLHARHRPG
ncbi:ROK family protein [Actinomyces sp. W5033]|uniref:ROK family protein n=1 Tax=Actinomyces sp. W5033 TaxID=3446479 RepID=UPI003EE13AD1